MVPQVIRGACWCGRNVETSKHLGKFDVDPQYVVPGSTKQIILTEMTFEPGSPGSAGSHHLATLLACRTW